jgi:hypothetical protein
MRRAAWNVNAPVGQSPPAVRHWTPPDLACTIFTTILRSIMDLPAEPMTHAALLETRSPIRSPTPRPRGHGSARPRRPSRHGRHAARNPGGAGRRRAARRRAGRDGRCAGGSATSAAIAAVPPPLLLLAPARAAAALQRPVPSEAAAVAVRLSSLLADPAVLRGLADPTAAQLLPRSRSWSTRRRSPPPPRAGRSWPAWCRPSSSCPPRPDAAGYRRAARPADGAGRRRPGPSARHGGANPPRRRGPGPAQRTRRTPASSPSAPPIPASSISPS